MHVCIHIFVHNGGRGERIIMRDIIFRNFSDMNIYQCIVWFFIYSFLGWCMECVVIRVQLGYWENRGFAKLPFCVIYGFGCVGAFTLFAPFAKYPLALFLAGCIGGTIFEYIVAMVMIRLFGELWWNYDHKRFNYKGILCLQSSFAWGVICVLLFMVINVRIKYMVHAINPVIVRPLAIVLFVSYTIDFARQFYCSIKDKNSEKNTERMA